MKVQSDAVHGRGQIPEHAKLFNVNIADRENIAENLQQEAQSQIDQNLQQDATWLLEHRWQSSSRILPTMRERSAQHLL